MRLRFHPEANAELADARAWYAERNVVAAEQFVDEVLRVIEMVSTLHSDGPSANMGAPGSSSPVPDYWRYRS